MIVLDTNVLVYALSEGHTLVEPSRRILENVSQGRLRATTIAPVIQEFAHVRTRRRGRADATRHAREWLAVLSPLAVVDESDLNDALRLFERLERLDAFDAVLAAVALNREAEALVSADAAFTGIRGLKDIDPATPALEELLRN